MRAVRHIVLGLCSLSLLLILTPGAKASFYQQTTIATFSSPVEIPGQILPAGTYRFEVADINILGNRHIVQVYTANGMKLIATAMAIPRYRQAPTDNPVFMFEERGSDQPQALRAWFYPGYTEGHQFAYGPVVQTTAAKWTVTSTPIETAAVVPEAQAEENVEVAQNTQPEQAPAAEQQAPVAAPETPAPAEKELPKTASTMPLIALIGILSLGGALGLKVLAARVS